MPSKFNGLKSTLPRCAPHVLVIFTGRAKASFLRDRQTFSVPFLKPKTVLQSDQNLLDPNNRIANFHHLMKCELPLSKGFSDRSFLVPLHLLLQPLDLSHQPLLFGQHLLEHFPGPTFYSFEVDGWQECLEDDDVICNLYSPKTLSNIASSNLPSAVRRISSFIRTSPFAWEYLTISLTMSYFILLFYKTSTLTNKISMILKILQP